jgi:hypothetical protein
MSIWFHRRNDTLTLDRVLISPLQIPAGEAGAKLIDMIGKPGAVWKPMESGASAAPIGKR